MSSEVLRRVWVVAACAAALALSACNSVAAAVGSTLPPVGTSAARFSTADEKTYGAALAFYDAALPVYDATVIRNPSFPQAQVANAVKIRQKVTTLRLAAKGIHDGLNAGNLGEETKAFLGALAQMKSIMPAAAQAALPALPQ